MKRCTDCNELLSLDSFWKHNQKPDGLYNSCSQCMKTKKKKYRNENIEKIRAYERSVSSKDYKVKSRNRYKGTQAYRDSHKRSQAKWIYNNKKAKRCHSAVWNAIGRGDLKKKPCVVCDTNKNIHAHHCDYNKPLDVMWLCPKHHKEWHSKNEPIL